MTYHHPLYSVQAIDAQRRHHEINGQRGTYYCGAYWGYGFHEDGVRSALALGSSDATLTSQLSPMNRSLLGARNLNQVL